MHKKSVLPLAIATAMAGGVALASAPAQALETSCQVSKVGWASRDGGTVTIECGGNNHEARGTTPVCQGGVAPPNAPAETRKAWLSAAQMARLSGRPIYIEFSDCQIGGNILRILSFVRLSS